MASGDSPNAPNHMTYSRSKVPVLGALLDYMDTSLEYLRRKTFSRAERLNSKAYRTSLSPTFMAGVCLILGLVSNVKLEVVTFSEEPLPNDLHFVLMSKDDNLYIDDIDTSRVMCCIEASDTLLILISTLLIWNSGYVRSPLSEYLFLPWLGAVLRGFFLRQVPTAGALLYTMAVINGNILDKVRSLLVLEARLWLEIARVVRMRWEKRDHIDVSEAEIEVETLWSNEDVQSVEVRNYVY